MSKISPIIQPEDLLALNDQGKEFMLVDADGGGKERYLAGHLAGAYFVDLTTELSGPVDDPANGGRHPLPDPKVFAGTISKLGINSESHVIIYDDKNGSNAAARFWWMLTAIGYAHVQVLNGGFKAAIRVGYPVNADVAMPRPVPIDTSITDWQLPTVNLEEVEIASKTQHQTIVDVRAQERYDGWVEPLDLVAGHIPNAINLPLADNLDEQGVFKEPSILKKKYSEALQDKRAEDIIVHCGSGVTACHTLLAFAYAGLAIPSLYVGSWSEWSRSGNGMVLKAQ